MSIQALRERKLEISRLANKLLADKGEQTWSKEDQATFDGYMDEATRVEAQITAHQKALDLRAEKTFSDVETKTKDGKAKNERQQGYELFLRKNFRDMTPEEVGLVRNTMSTTTGSQGGFTVQSEVSSQFIDQLKDYGGMRRVADRIVTAMGNPMNFPLTDGRAEVGEVIAQNTTATTADATFATVPVTAWKFGSKIITVPIELLQDSQIDVTALVNKRMRDRIGRIQNLKFTVGAGDGSSEPFGLVTGSSVGVTGTSGQTLTIIYDNLVGMIEAIDYAYQQEGEPLSWLCSQTMRGVIRKIKDTSGRPIYLPGYGSITEELGDSLLGYPLQINNDMAVPAANAKSLAFGQMKKYLIRDTMEVTLFRFDDSAFMKLGQVGFLAWARAGGNVLDTAAVTLYQHSAT